MLTFCVPGKPEGKRRPRFAGRRAYDPPENIAYARGIQFAFLDAAKGKWKKPEHVRVGITACYVLPKSTTKKKKAYITERGIPPAVKPDADNIAKAVLDALNGLAYDDDKAVCALSVEKVYSDREQIIVSISDYCETVNNDMVTKENV